MHVRMRLHETDAAGNSLVPEEKDSNTRLHSTQPTEYVAGNVLET
jgi:hypothetical protein